MLQKVPLSAWAHLKWRVCNVERYCIKLLLLISLHSSLSPATSPNYWCCHCYSFLLLLSLLLVSVLFRQIFMFGWLQLKQGRASITMPFNELVKLVPSGYGSNHVDAVSYMTIFVFANVTERATGKILSGNSTVECHSNLYKLEFLDMTPNNYKPGLSFTGYVSHLHAVYFVFVLFLSLIKKCMQQLD